MYTVGVIYQFLALRAPDASSTFVAVVAAAITLAPGNALRYAQGPPQTSPVTIRVEASHVLNRVSSWLYGACIEDVNHEIYGGLGAQRVFGESFEEPPAGAAGVSGMWEPVRAGSAQAEFRWEADRPFNGTHSQRVTFNSGSGAVGVANSGLNRWGIAIRRGEALAGHLYARSDAPAPIVAALQSADGARVYATARLPAPGPDWSKREFTLRPSVTDRHARLALYISRPGSVCLDQVYLAGTGGALFRGGPFRADVGEALVREHLTFLRYGGSMVNAPQYRWNKMVGDPDRRSPYRGTWYPYSSNRFGIEEFLRFCELAHFGAAFAINIDETAEDANDMVEYLNGPLKSRWGRVRARNGHPKPYNVRWIEIGNEEAINGDAAWYARYLERFKALERAIHGADPKIGLVIAAWWRPEDPWCRRIAEGLRNRAALWDVHVGGDDLNDGEAVDRTLTRMQQLFHEWIPGSALKACIFEENGGRHDFQRALGHAHMLNVTQRHGDFVLMDCPANCLQPLGQNDNGWDQGQVFFTPDRVWGMPPYWAQQMASLNHLPNRVESEITGPAKGLDVTATRSDDGDTVVVSVVNSSTHACRSAIRLEGMVRSAHRADAWTLASEDVRAVNTADEPERIRWHRSELSAAPAEFTFAPYSYAILRFH